MVWIDKGPKYVLILVISAVCFFLLSHTYSTVYVGSRKEEELGMEANLNSNLTRHEIWLNQVVGKLQSKAYNELSPLLTKLEREYRQDDPDLVRIVREKYLLTPSLQSYNLESNPDFDTSMGQADAVRQILHEKRNGFFVECGALDGETRSNSLILERQFGWEGVLIEGDLVNLMQCRDKRRKAWLVPACLSTQMSSMHVPFRSWGNIGSIVDDKELPKDNLSQQDPEKVINVTCVPFYTIMLALNRTTVDYFSLDVEGNELDILKTIPFKEMDIKVISAEFFHTAENGNSKEEMRRFMSDNGYDVHSIVTHPLNLANDFIFVKRGTI